MKISVPKISLEALSKKETQIFNNLNSICYGEELALKISAKLIKVSIKNSGVYFSHRDYCGLGIFFDKEKFILSTVYDGYENDVVVTFDSKQEFIEWLSKENNQSMSLYGKEFNNQTITKVSLEWFLEKNYSPVWNSSCSYIRERLA